MPRFHLNILNGIGRVADEPGQELVDIDAAKEQAILGIRSILSAEVLEGVIDLGGRIEIADPAGHVLLVVPYAEALTIRFPQAAA